MVAHIESMAEFKTATECGKVVVIDFTASWCGPCKMISPLFEKCSKDFPHARFYKVDVDDSADVAEHCGIRAMPTFIFYKDGVKVDELRGADTEKLLEKLKKHCS